MSVLLAEMTRQQIRAIAPTAIAVLPTASVEQHGPHLPVITDTLLCGTVAERAARRASQQVPVVVTPVLCYGNSHHHRPFPGVLSLSSPIYLAAVTEILEGLILSGFRKLLILNGHGGNTDSNAVVALDIVNRLGHPVAIATASYWDIARPAIVEQQIMAGMRVPGHAGRFETSLVLAIRPELVDPAVLSKTEPIRESAKGLFSALAGGTVQVHGVWAASPGYTDEPAAASAEEGARLLALIEERVAEFIVAFDQSS
jgi:creatinine amidohydrolase